MPNRITYNLWAFVRENFLKKFNIFWNTGKWLATLLSTSETSELHCCRSTSETSESAPFAPRKSKRFDISPRATISARTKKIANNFKCQIKWNFGARFKKMQKIGMNFCKKFHSLFSEIFCHLQNALSNSFLENFLSNFYLY